MRTYVFPKVAAIIAFSLLLAACGGTTGGGPSAADLSATQQSLQATQQALNAQQAPTNTSQPQAAESPTAQSQAATEAPASGSEAFYTEEFDSSPSDWTYVTYTGSNNSNAGSNFDVYVDNGRLVFDIPDENVWIYYGPDSWSYTDVRIDTRATNKGNNNNNVTMFCRYNDRGWYEANVANSGLYWIYRYESSTDSFNLLYNGGVQNLKTGKATNDFTLICKGNSITLGVNGAEIRTVKDNMFDEGLIGVGVSSFDGVPVLVEFDSVAISTP